MAMKADSFADPSETARQWWREDAAMLLPEERGGETVFEIRFWDGYRYIGHTDSSVFERVDNLVASPYAERRSVFVGEHCARMGSVVRVVASGLDEAAAAELRDEMTLQAPEAMQRVDEASLQAPECFLAEVPAEPARITFAEWAKTSEEPETEGES